MSDHIPSYRWWPGDWRRDPKAQALTYEERGVYRELLDLMWMYESDGCYLPDDDRAISQMLGVTIARWCRIRRVIVDGPRAVLRAQDGRIINPRLSQEWSDAVAQREASRRNGSLGGRPQKPGGVPGPKPKRNPGVLSLVNPTGTQAETKTEPSHSPSPSHSPMGVAVADAPARAREADPAPAGSGTALYGALRPRIEAAVRRPLAAEEAHELLHACTFHAHADRLPGAVTALERDAGRKPIAHPVGYVTRLANDEIDEEGERDGDDRRGRPWAARKAGGGRGDRATDWDSEPERV